MVKETKTKKSTTKPKKVVVEEQAEDVVETQTLEQPKKKKTGKKKEQPAVIEEPPVEEMDVEDDDEPIEDAEEIVESEGEEDDPVEDEEEGEEEEQVEEEPAPKTKKRGRKPKPVEPEPDEAEPKQDVEAARIEKAISLGEIKTSEELKALTAEYYKKHYSLSKGFIDFYNKNFVPKKVREPWEQADKLLTDAGVTKSKWLGLKGAESIEETQLVKAVPALKLAGEKKFDEAMEIIKTLSPEDAEKLWAVQERNKGVTKFEDLVCKSDYQKMLLRQKIEQEIAQANKQ